MLNGITEMAGKVETDGQLTRGMTVFDRRTPGDWRINMDVATKIDVAEVEAAVVRGLKFSGQQT